MPLCIPGSACTPEGFRPKIDSDAPNPLTREKSLVLDSFFFTENLQSDGCQRSMLSVTERLPKDLSMVEGLCLPGDIFL
jgi:hypothetical protein